MENESKAGKAALTAKMNMTMFSFFKLYSPLGEHPFLVHTFN